MNFETFHYPPYSWGFSVEKKGGSPSLINQVHGNKILSLTEASSLEDADGIQTHLLEKPIHVFSADCIPLLFFSEDLSEPIAAIHAGWRGVKIGIIEKAVSLFQAPSLLHVVVGPSIGFCCFRIREDFLEDWKQAGRDPNPFLTKDGNGYRFNLFQYVLQISLKEVFPGKIHLDSYRCTVCSKPSLPSFRRNKTANPRIRSWITKHSEHSTSLTKHL